MKIFSLLRISVFVGSCMLQVAKSAANEQDDLSSSIVLAADSFGVQILFAKQLVGKERESWIKGTAEQISLLSKILFNEKSRILQGRTYASNDLYNALASKMDGMHHVFFDTFGKVKDAKALDNTVLSKAASDINHISAELKKICK